MALPIMFLFAGGCDQSTIPSNEQSLEASDGENGDVFGQSVAIGDNKLVVGAPGDSAVGIYQHGSVYVYDLDGTNEVNITASDKAEGDQFGISVAVGCNKIVVGSWLSDVSGNTNQGAAYIYDLDGSNEIKVTASNGASNDNFGRSVAIGDNKIVIGAPYDDNNGTNSGSAYIYDLDGSNEVQITASDGAASDFFGHSVAIGSSIIVVGSYGKNIGTQFNQGSVYLFDLEGNQTGIITASNPQGTLSEISGGGGNFGEAVAIGNRKIIVGERNRDHAGNIGAGSAYIYDLDGTNEIEITASDKASYDAFGFSVGIGNGRIIVGAPYNDDNGGNSGSVYVFNLNGDQLDKLVPSGISTNYWYGEAVSIGHGKIAGGANYSVFPPIGQRKPGYVYIHDTPLNTSC
jgi:predicted secreted protein